MAKDKIEKKRIEFPWKVYGGLVAPLEAFVLFLHRDTTLGLWHLLKIMVLISFFVIIIPMILRIVLRFLHKDFFDMSDMAKVLLSSVVGLVILWFILVLIGTRNEKILSKVLSVIFLVPAALCPHVLVYYFLYMFGGLISGDKDYYSTFGSSSTNREVKVEEPKKKKPSFSRKDIYDQNGRQIATTYKIDNGMWTSTEVYDEFGNYVGEANTVDYGEFSETTVKNKMGNPTKKITKYK